MIIGKLFLFFSIFLIIKAENDTSECKTFEDVCIECSEGYYFDS